MMTLGTQYSGLAHVRSGVQGSGMASACVLQGLLRLLKRRFVDFPWAGNVLTDAGRC